MYWIIKSFRVFLFLFFCLPVWGVSNEIGCGTKAEEIKLSKILAAAFGFVRKTVSNLLSFAWFTKSSFSAVMWLPPILPQVQTSSCKGPFTRCVGNNVIKLLNHLNIVHNFLSFWFRQTLSSEMGIMAPNEGFHTAMAFLIVTIVWTGL